ncbi:MAG: NTP transferase domain-containing protein [Candidatus Eisenbacteria bacterium]
MTLGVVLAGGRGARMARPEPKALVMLLGRSLLARAQATLAALCDEVLVSAPAELELGVPAASRVADPPGAQGPLAGLVAGLASRRFTRALVLAVDLPLATAAALRALEGHLASGDDVVLAAPGGIPQPLAAWYAPSAAAPLAAALASGERSATRAVLALRVRVIESTLLAMMPGGESAYFNLNVPADLDEAERRCREGSG